MTIYDLTLQDASKSLTYYILEFYLGDKNLK